MTAAIDPSPDTRHRLLEAAGEIFAEHGFRQTTVRDIIERAGTNVAAVNYHFGDKLKLYSAVVSNYLSAAVEKHPIDGGAAPGAPAAERLGAFIESFLFRLLGDGVPAWHGKLMAREMAEPTPGVIEELVRSHVRPHSSFLFGLVRELMGCDAADQAVHRCAFSIVGQCLFYRHCQPMVAVMAPDQRFGKADLAQLAQHIVRFSLAGIAAARLTPARKERPHRLPPPQRSRHER